MASPLRALLLLCCVHLAAFTDPECVIDLECEECLPDNMPLVTSHRAANGTVRVAAGEEVTLACGAGSFLAYPLRAAVSAACEAGRYRVRPDGALRSLLELGCQEAVFEDVLHAVPHCAPPLQARVYRYVPPAGDRRPRHLAALCFDADRALAVRATATGAAGNALPLPPHEERAAPLSLLGNFNHMFDARTRHDAERLFGDEARLQRRLAELLRPEGVSLAGQALVAAPLLAPHYFEDQHARVAAFASNRVLAWRSVAAGNLRHAQRDVGRLVRRRGLTVHAGTRGVAALRTEGRPLPLFAWPGRFPVPRYVWTVALDAQRRRALAVVVLNDPFVAVSEIRAAVFCESACGRARWARQLRRHRRYETPLLGLTFCCDVHSFAAVVSEMPRELLQDIPPGEQGMLLDDYDDDHDTAAANTLL